jgi:uncharacterized protein YabE (DUF348 family)
MLMTKDIATIHRARIILAVGLLALFGCQTAQPAIVTVIDQGRVQRVISDANDARSLLARAGLTLAPADRLLVDGSPVSLDNPVPHGRQITVQVKRAVAWALNGQPQQTSATTVGEALAELGLTMYAADALDPPASTSISPGIAVKFVPSRALMVLEDGHRLQGRSAVSTTAEALAETGSPLINLDTAQPADLAGSQAPSEVHITRTAEVLDLDEQRIPYETSIQDAPEIELGQDEILQPGVAGLSIVRTLTRLEDGREVARRSEARAVIRPPQDRVVGRGSKIVTQSLNINGVTIQYWRMLQMYATVYSPCNSATGAAGGCSTGTASGLRAGKGVVAVDPSLFSYLNGQRLFIPGYGFAVVGDIGGGYIVERNLGISRYKWIDLGFDDNDLQDMTGWLTVYFLTPAPATIPDALK